MRRNIGLECREFTMNGVSYRAPMGIAHFLEHKLFENEDGSDTFARFAALGASANAFTSNAMTAYYFDSTEKFEENFLVISFINDIVSLISFCDIFPSA